MASLNNTPSRHTAWEYVEAKINTITGMQILHLSTGTHHGIIPQAAAVSNQEKQL